MWIKLYLGAFAVGTETVLINSEHISSIEQHKVTLLNGKSYEFPDDATRLLLLGAMTDKKFKRTKAVEITSCQVQEILGRTELEPKKQKLRIPLRRW